MSATAATPSHTTIEFPTEEIARVLRKWWRDRLDDPFTPRERENTLYETLPAVDSLSATEVLVIIEEIVGFEIPVEVVKRGGYENDDEMIAHLLPRIEKLHAKRQR